MQFQFSNGSESLSGEFSLGEQEKRDIFWTVGIVVAVIFLSMIHTFVSIITKIAESVAAAVIPRPENTASKTELAETVASTRRLTEDLRMQVARLAAENNTYDRLLRNLSAKENPVKLD